ncbi:MAG: hypothetical protein HZA49_07095 [Planctomycetes bacterium]|nr:hypothetical protein [Planctomycetota bacterium]
MDFKSRLAYFRNNILIILLVSLPIPLATLVLPSLRVLPGPATVGVLADFGNFCLAIPFLLTFFIFRYIAIPCLIIGFIIGRKGNIIALIGLVLLIIWLGQEASWRGTYKIRTWAMHKAAGRSEPIINALKQFKEKNGSYPVGLEELIPYHLSNIPDTGMSHYRKYEYTKKSEYHEAGGYELWIKTPIGGINWDVFVYWPSENYPSRMKGGSVERISKWAYVHE